MFSPFESSEEEEGGRLSTADLLASLSASATRLGDRATSAFAAVATPRSPLPFSDVLDGVLGPSAGAGDEGESVLIGGGGCRHGGY